MVPRLQRKIPQKDIGYVETSLGCGPLDVLGKPCALCLITGEAPLGQDQGWLDVPFDGAGATVKPRTANCDVEVLPIHWSRTDARFLFYIGKQRRQFVHEHLPEPLCHSNYFNVTPGSTLLKLISLWKTIPGVENLLLRRWASTILDFSAHKSLVGILASM